MDRNCNKCIHHTSGLCSKWDCEMTTLEDYRDKVIDEFAERIKELFKYESAWYKTMYHQRLVIDIGKIDEIAEQLKAGVKNE